MDISKGYLRLFRQMLEWEWYDKPNTKVIFIHCLLCANQKEKIWQGIKIKRGQFVTTLEKLSTANGLTIRQTRTALNDLQKTNEIDRQTTSRYSIITVKNYNLYQANDKQTTQETTNKRQTNDKPIFNNNRENYNLYQANDKQTTSETTTTNNIDIYSNNINTHTMENKKSVCELPKISKEDREILKNYARKSKASNITAYVHTLIANGGYLEILEQEKQKTERKKQKEICAAAEKIEVKEDKEITEAAFKKFKEQAKLIRRKQND